MTNFAIELGLVLIAIGMVNLVSIALVLAWLDMEALEREYDECRREVKRFERGFGSRSR